LGPPDKLPAVDGPVSKSSTRDRVNWLAADKTRFLPETGGGHSVGGWVGSVGGERSLQPITPALRRLTEPRLTHATDKNPVALTARSPRGRLQACPIWRRLHGDWSGRLACLRRMRCASHESSTNSRAQYPAQLVGSKSHLLSSLSTRPSVGSAAPNAPRFAKTLTKASKSIDI
jgi:hypothetical protein